MFTYYREHEMNNAEITDIGDEKCISILCIVDLAMLNCSNDLTLFWVSLAH